ncbi:hypothetical protein [Heyndrickxia ginsengihumi]|uniref:hypothetical protein n=1 Tax=Heyndrickxia ginsengihumi TaxID=363870 RepID=UPI00203C9FD1|nr:hypothetical protein [Heyndrickxia ginsengihumi]MCM3024626.1 hypothetical protein [Heyndrickxia ginsengihumi]
MEDLISKLNFSWPQWIPLGLIILSSLITGINNINATDIEKRLMTDAQKLKIFILIILGTFIFLSAYIFGLYVITSPEVLKEFSIQAIIFASMFLSGIAEIIVFLIFNLVVVFLKRKYQFYIIIDGSKWYIARRQNKKEILLRDKDNMKYLSYEFSKIKRNIFYKEVINNKKTNKKKLDNEIKLNL